MKSLLFSVLVSLTILSKAQETQFVNDTIITTSGYKIYKGVVLKLGRGTMMDGSFKYIRLSGSSTNSTFSFNNSGAKSGPYATVYHSGKSGEVASTKKVGNNKSGYEYFAILKMGEMNRYECDVENAIAAGEIVLPSEFKKPDVVQSSGAGMSNLAEELGKLKKMYTDSLITKEEYEAAKKKLLGNN
jgi:hypothetical protein